MTDTALTTTEAVDSRAEADAPPQGGAAAWWITALLTAAMLLSYIDRSVLALLTDPIKASLALTDIEMGLLQGASFGLVFTVTMLPLGWLADRVSRPRLIGCAIALWSLFTAGCGLATNFTQMFLARMGVAVGEAVLSPAGPSLIADHFPPERRTLPLGIYGMAAGVGISLSLIAGGLVASVLGDGKVVTVAGVGTFETWQAIFLVLGLPGWALSVIFLCSPDRRRLQARSADASWGDLLAMIRLRRHIFIPHLAGYCLNSLFSFAMQAWQPAFFMRVHGWTIAEVGLRIGIIQVVFYTLGALVGGIVARKLWQGGRADADYWTAAIFVGLGVFPAIAATLVADAFWAALLMGIAAMCTIAPAGAFLSAIQGLTPAPLRARMTAIYFIVLGLSSMTAGPLLVGIMNDHLFTGTAGISRSLALTAALVLPAGSLLLVLAGRRRASVDFAN